MFVSEAVIEDCGWQAFERLTARLLLHRGFENVRIVGQTGDKGADILAHKNGKRWLVQVKHWKTKVGLEVSDETLRALQIYRAQVPVIVCRSGFSQALLDHQKTLMSRGISLQLWDKAELSKLSQNLPLDYPGERTAKPYQKEPIETAVAAVLGGKLNRALIVMATGLGKTFVAFETIRRIRMSRPIRVLVIVHRNEIVYQLERAAWKLLTAKDETVVWNGQENPGDDALNRATFVFACVDSVSSAVESGSRDLSGFDLVVIDECHHAGEETKYYGNVLAETMAGKPGGPFLLGLTATPWRPGEDTLKQTFGDAVVCIDMAYGMRRGYLANVDYRIHTDNINWDALSKIKGSRFSPRQINDTLFIEEWDDAVIDQMQKAWGEQKKPKAIVFCRKIDHAITMRDRINARGFCNAAAIYSQTDAGHAMRAFERSRLLCDFHDGTVDVICAVDIFNEGVDVPDVNLIVFQRVSHSRRIFIQQLGRGLRTSEDKEKVIVLDFVSDIRRFAATIDLKNKLSDGESPPKPAGDPYTRIALKHKVTFRRAGEDDGVSEARLRAWLGDVASIEDAGEDAAILQLPPHLEGMR